MFGKFSYKIFECDQSLNNVHFEHANTFRNHFSSKK